MDRDRGTIVRDGSCVYQDRASQNKAIEVGTPVSAVRGFGVSWCDVPGSSPRKSGQNMFDQNGRLDYYFGKNLAASQPSVGEDRNLSELFRSAKCPVLQSFCSDMLTPACFTGHREVVVISLETKPLGNLMYSDRRE